MAKRVQLHNCPPGLFLFIGDGGPCLGFMSEYATVVGNFVQRDAYVVASGEYFWGGTSDSKKRAKLLVMPLDDAAILARALKDRKCHGRRPR